MTEQAASEIKGPLPTQKVENKTELQRPHFNRLSRYVHGVVGRSKAFINEVVVRTKLPNATKVAEKALFNAFVLQGSGQVGEERLTEIYEKYKQMTKKPFPNAPEATNFQQFVAFLFFGGSSEGIKTF